LDYGAHLPPGNYLRLNLWVREGKQRPIHQEVGRRFALEEEKIIYGKSSIQASPVYETMKIEGKNNRKKNARDTHFNGSAEMK
jgi:hypothetical protein